MPRRSWGSSASRYAPNSYLVIPLALLMSGAYVLMALVEEAWLEQHYGTSYSEYCSRTSRFLDVAELRRRSML
jgi:protein-S-isoprenylcysteine O-methyltransferase Ste14